MEKIKHGMVLSMVEGMDSGTIIEDNTLFEDFIEYGNKCRFKVTGCDFEAIVKNIVRVHLQNINIVLIEIEFGE